MAENIIDTPPDNSTIKHLRETIDTLTRDKAAAESKATELESRLTSIEREKMDENERLKAEKADLEAKAKEADALRDENGRYTTAFKSIYDQELSAVPEEHRERLQKHTSSGTYAERVEALRDLKALLPAAQTARPIGTITNPGTPGAVQPMAPAPAAPTDPKNWGGASLSDMARERLTPPDSDPSRLPK